MLSPRSTTRRTWPPNQARIVCLALGMLTFLATAVLISLSGVMAPGPITAVAIGRGSEDQRLGTFLALGHGIIEIPLMTAILFGLSRLLQLPHLRTGISLAGAIFLVVMAVGMLRPPGKAPEQRPSQGSPLLLGALLTLGNPYFFVWWGTIGANLILSSISYGPWGFVALASSHWSCDLAWDTLLSVTSFRGSRLLGKRFQRYLFVACGLVLILFAAELFVQGIRSV